MKPFVKVKKLGQAHAGAGWNRHVDKWTTRYANKVIRRWQKRHGGQFVMEIVKKSWVEEIVEYWHEFECRDIPGAGASFPVNAKGKQIGYFGKPPNPVAVEHYAKCLTGVNGRGDVMIDKGIRRVERHYRHPAEGKCDCGHVLALSEFTNTCERCGRDYNFAGQRLAPRSQWGWDTGESESEILNIGHHVG